MSWLVGSILSIIFFSAVNAFARYFSPKISSVPALFIQVSTTIIVLIAIFLFTKSYQQMPKLSTKPELVAVILAGISWLAGQLILYTVFAKNPPLTVVVPLITSGVAIGGVITGLLFFGESLSIVRSIAIVIVIFGSILLVKS